MILIAGIPCAEMADLNGSVDVARSHLPGPCACADCAMVDLVLSDPAGAWRRLLEAGRWERQDAYREPEELRRLARCFPDVAWLCGMPPEDRAYFLAGEVGTFTRTQYPAVPEAAWGELGAP